MQYIFKLIKAVVSRLKTLTMNPIRNLTRKFQMLMNTNVVANKLLKPVTKKFRELFHIKPKSERDYYSVGRLLIAKKLITAVIVGCCIAVFAYFYFVAEPVEKPVTTTMGMVSNVYFDYDDMELSEYSGRANIRAANGRVVYTGDIKNGVCEGKGILYNQSGVVIYEGDFAENKYSGQGKGYSPGGLLQYEGEYANNVYEGEGTAYHPSGQIRYKGGFSGGFYSGMGICYEEDGSLIYQGEFQNGLYHGTGTLFYQDGVRKYEGEFVMGRPQGTGTLYTVSGRPCYTGIVADGTIAHEALLSLSMAEIKEMFHEEPEVYYSQDSTCYVYESAGVVLETDCMVKIVTQEIAGGEETPRSGDGWYLPEEFAAAPATVRAEEDTAREETAGGEAEAEARDQDMPQDYVTEKHKVYFYINDEEWVPEEELDPGSIRVKAVAVYGGDLRNPFSGDQERIAVNAMAGLADCIVIEKARRYAPSLFGNITFESIRQNYRYTYIKNMNHAQALYAELVDKENFSYQLCYEADDAQNLCYYKVSAVQ